MHRLEIQRFGPISKVEIPTSNFTILTGPQASGKSTVAKAEFYFRSLRDELIRYILDILETGTFEKNIAAFSKRLRAKFLAYWGPSHRENHILRYSYGNGVVITVGRRRGYVDPRFNKKFGDRFFELIDYTRAFKEELQKRDTSFLGSTEILELESKKRSFFSTLEKKTRSLFNEDKEQIFIPAGRSLVATLADQLQNVHPHKLDYLTRAFIERVNHTKQLFNKSLTEIVTDKKKLTEDIIDFGNIKLAMELVPRILQAEYRADADGEKLYYDDNAYTKLSFASSGQQEVVWILLQVFLMILDRKPVFAVIEEPEAHLFPEAQYDMLKLLALLNKVAGAQLTITTHSPYVLSSLNNLIYASIVGKKHPKKSGGVIRKEFWLDSSDVSAYELRNGRAYSIKDEETGLIESDVVDSASGVINKDYDELFNADS